MRGVRQEAEVMPPSDVSTFREGAETVRGVRQEAEVTPPPSSFKKLMCVGADTDIFIPPMPSACLGQSHLLVFPWSADLPHYPAPSPTHSHLLELPGGADLGDLDLALDAHEQCHAQPAVKPISGWSEGGGRG